MKLLKLSVTCLILLTFFLTTIAFASDELTIKDLLVSDCITSLELPDNLKTASDKSINQIQHIIGSDNKTANSINLDTNESLETDNYFKMYNLSDPDIVKSYKTNGNLEANISQDFTWNTTISQGNEMILLATFSNNDENWELVGFTDAINTDLVKTFSKRESIESILVKNNIKDASELKLVSADKYHINFIYIKKDNIEYAIPFSNKPDVIGISNGKLYEISKLINILDKYSKGMTDTNNMVGGGIGSTPIKPIKFASSIIMLSSLILLLGINANRFFFVKR